MELTVTALDTPPGGVTACSTRVTRWRVQVFRALQHDRAAVPDIGRASQGRGLAFERSRLRSSQQTL